MKKSLAVIVAVLGCVAFAGAQGQFIMDSSANSENGSDPFATSGGRVWLDPNGGSVADATLNTDTDVNLMLLWGTTPNSVNEIVNLDPQSLNNPPNTSWLANQPTGAGDITRNADGTIFDPNGLAYVIPGAAAGTTIYLQLFAWTGTSTTYADALNRGATGVFSTVLFSGSSPNPGDISGMSALVIQPVPEPGMFTLTGFGAGALLLLRRRRYLFGERKA